jgi:hypothetical protein
MDLWLKCTKKEIKTWTFGPGVLLVHLSQRFMFYFLFSTLEPKVHVFISLKYTWTKGPCFYFFFSTLEPKVHVLFPF